MTEPSNANPYESPQAGPEAQKTIQKGTGPQHGCAAVFFLVAGSLGLALGAFWTWQFSFHSPEDDLMWIGLVLGVGMFLPSLFLLWFGIALIRSQRW